MSYFTLCSLFLLRFIPHYFLLLYPFRQHFKGSRKRLAVSLGVAVVVLLLSILILNPRIPFCDKKWIMFAMIFDTFASLLILRYNVQLGLPKLLFSFFFIKCYTDEANLFAYILRSFLRDIGFITDLATGFIFCTFFLGIIFVPPLLKFSDRYLHPVLADEYNLGWHRLWIIPAVFFCLFACGVYIIMFCITPSANDYVITIFIHLLQTMGTIITCYVLLKMIGKEHEEQQIQLKLASVSTSLQLQKREYQRLQDVIDHTRKLRHDFRHNLSVVKCLLNEKKYQELLLYVNSYLKGSKLEESTVLCDNFAINALMQYYLSLAKEADVETEIKLALPQNLPMPEPDLATLLGNMVENAIEGCMTVTKGRRYLKVKAGIQGKMIVLAVSNNYDGKIVENDGVFLSSKQQYQKAGIGTDSIRTLVEQYGGKVKFTYGDGRFEAAVLLRTGQI